jgi:hypothetical protein
LGRLKAFCGGENVVRAWWIAWWIWCFDRHFSGVEKYATLSKFIFDDLI